MTTHQKELTYSGSRFELRPYIVSDPAKPRRGFSPKKDLLALNLEVARREEAGEPVTAPGIPPGYPDPARPVTEDCIRAD